MMIEESGLLNYGIVMMFDENVMTIEENEIVIVWDFMMVFLN
jgi:hypothetical protein